MAKKKITQLDPATSVNSDAIFPLSQEDNNEAKTFKGTIEQLGDYINKSQGFNTLNTTSKKVIGAINEVLADANKDIINAITTPAPIMTFNDGGDNIPVNKLLVAVTAQQASGTPTPSSPLPIIGWSQAQITRTGKNLCPYLEQGQLSQTTGEEVASDTVRRSGFIRVEAGQTYAFSNLSTSSTQTNKRLRVFYYDRWKTYISNDTTDLYDTSVNVTIPSGVGYIRFQASGTVLTETNAQVEKGSTPTTYEAYKGITVTIPFGDTYYGGVLDVTNGKLTVTHKLSEHTWSEFTKTTLTDYTRGLLNITSEGMGINTNPTDICNIAPFKANYSEDSNHFYLAVTSTATNLYVFLPNDTASTTAIQVCYELATPVIINLTPTQITTLAGLNNIYADCGDIQLLEYFNGNADDIAELNRAMSDDFHVYSTAEQIVGKWLGEDLYEKSYHYTQATVPTQATAVVIDNAISNLNLASLVDMTCAYKTHHISQNYDVWYHGALANTQLDYSTGNLLFYQKATSQQQNYNNLEVNITIRYTKAS